MHSVGAGPALVTDGRARGAFAAEIRKADGSANESGAIFWDSRARALVADGHQSLAGTIGPVAVVGARDGNATLGRASIEGGFGLEHAHDKVFFDAVGAIHLGVGFVVDRHEARTSSPFGDADFGAAWQAGMLHQPPRSQWFARTRTVLTLDVMTEINARFTRAPLGAFGLLVGVAWLEETFARVTPAIPWLR